METLPNSSENATIKERPVIPGAGEAEFIENSADFSSNYAPASIMHLRAASIAGIPM